MKKLNVIFVVSILVLTSGSAHCANTIEPQEKNPIFKVISSLIRLPDYMDELIAIPMAQRQQSIQNAVQEYGKRLLGFIRSRVKNDQDAEDILQDVWYQLSSIIDTEPIELLSSWLYRVSKNRIVDKKRKHKPQPFSNRLKPFNKSNRTPSK